jgi:hypothetical protein
MAITVKHKFVSAIPDAGDTTVVQPSNWNDDHQLTGTVPIANGGTGASDAPTALTNLGAYPANNPSGYGTGTVTSVAATVPSFLSVTGSPITTSGTLALTYSGTALPVANGGTGVTSSSGANSVVLRDANVNINANAFNDGYTNTAASGTQIVLTAASVRRYTITGSGGQTIKLPDATTLSNGEIFEFDNNQSSGAVTVNNNSNTLIVSVPSGGLVRVNLLSNAIAAGSWDRHDYAPSNVSWSTNTLDYAGSITSATWNGTAVAINRGGTGQTTASTAFNALSPLTTAGDTLYGGTSGAGTRLAIGTAGQVLTVNSGATAPQWSTPTTGTVTSVAATVPAFLSVTGSPITSSGTLAIAYSGTALPVANGGTGATTLTGLVVGNGTSAMTTVTAPSGAVVGTTDTQTLTNKTITARVSSTTSIASPLADNSDNFDLYAATAQAGALTISADAGTPTDGRKIQFRFTCDATPRVITFTGGVSKGFKPVGVTMTTSGSDFTYTLTASKTTYFGAIYNTSSARWEIVALSQEV